MKIKNIVSAAIAAITTFTMTLSASATNEIGETSKEMRENVCIAGYDCWEEDGNYFAEVDGEVALVIDLTDLSRLSKCVTVTDFSAASLNTTRNLMYDVDLSDGEEYQGQIDITNGDCSTPIFFRNSECPYSKFKFKTKYVFGQTYSFTVYVDYADFDGYPYNNWLRSDDITITFSVFNQTYYPILLAYQSDYNSICKIKFHKEGSTGQSKFNYWMSAVA